MLALLGILATTKRGREKGKWKGKEVSSQEGKSGFEKVTGETS